LREAADIGRRRARLGGLLGGFLPTAFAIASRDPVKAGVHGCRVERLTLAATDGRRVRGFLTGPEGGWTSRPALLYCHAHGARYAIGASELIASRPALLPQPYAPDLAATGIVALSIDMPCFGESAADTESALSKRLLWEGRTLFGLMLSDLAGAFELLAGVDGVDADRICVFGVSMGATQAFWLAALEPRIRAVAHALAFADLATLVENGAHDLHGHYMTVPSLLPAFRTGEIAAMTAPRPQFAAMGALDPLTPPPALAAAVVDLRRGYGEAGAADVLTIFVDGATGHKETPAMRAAILDFLTRA